MGLCPGRLGCHDAVGQAAALLCSGRVMGIAIVEAQTLQTAMISRVVVLFRSYREASCIGVAHVGQSMRP